ncbi:MAG: hypothetical protein EHM21_01745, partial [Chloroflexi bacterium]
MIDTMAGESIWILPFTSEEAASTGNGVLIVGGKGANLARLAQAGLPVPDGFLLSTYAYRMFVGENRLEGEILAALPQADQASPEELEKAASRIRSMFSAGRIQGALVDDLTAAYGRLSERAGLPAVPVAVRSSATAEDLPEMSFAGQQDTYLNVVTTENVIKAVVDCWSSMWTARAIGYRLRNQVPQAGAALAVVVQRMVESQVSGVLFTANPLTGLRTETVIDATFGLGEALVSGKVEPDHYVVDAARGQIVSKELGAKALSIHGQPGGGTVEAAEDRKTIQAFPDEQILALANLGQRVAAYYGFPQDVEWAWAEDRLYLLQSRPITSLFPTPDEMPLEPLKLLFSFGAVQGMLDPVTPLGRDALRIIFSSASRLFGIHVTSETQTVLRTAGERLWIDITPIMRNSVGRRVMHGALDMIEPSIKQALENVWDDPQLQPERPGIRPRALFQLARFFVPLVGNVLLNLVAPGRRRAYIVANGEWVLEEMRQCFETLHGDRWSRLAQVANLMALIAEKHLPKAFPLFVSGVAAGMASLNFLRVMAKSLPDTSPGAKQNAGLWPDLVLETTRGVPNNPTTEMDLALWAVARAIRSDPAILAEFQDRPAVELASRYKTGEMQEKARALIAKFLDRYGGRGLGEIDMGRVRWLEDPTHVFEMVVSYLQIEEGDRSPDVVFTRSAEAAERALDQLAEGVRKTKGGWLKARLVRFFGRRVRELLGVRESPKFFAVRMMGLLRQELLRIGSSFVEAGDLQQVDDLFYLTFSEINRFGGRE